MKIKSGVAIFWLALCPVSQGMDYILALDEALHGKKTLNLRFKVVNGSLTNGVAHAPDFNRAFHEVDLRGLSIEGNRLTGFLGITLRPDGRIPRDGLPVECIFDVEADLDDGCVEGTYDGRLGSSDGQRSNYARGAVNGCYRKEQSVKAEAPES
ncbi:MAG: hypothetical protein AAF492_04390 [Verrucomicrobiota bacterium]